MILDEGSTLDTTPAESAACTHHWFAWARGKRTMDTRAIYCGDCRVVLTEYLARLEAENRKLRDHLHQAHTCDHDLAGLATPP